MHYVERVIDLPEGVSLETVIVYPRESVHGAESSANDASKTGASRLAVFCHPWSWLGGRMEDPVLRRLVAPFHERGYHVTLFNSRGVGNSTKWPSFSALAEADDLKNLVEILAEQLNEEHRLEHVILLGYSHGSVGVSHHPSVTMTLQGPPINTSHVLLSYPLSPLPLLTLFHHGSHAAALRDLVSDPDSDVLLVYGTRDQFTGESKYDAWIKDLELRAAKLEVHKIDRADHFWGGEAMQTLLEIVGIETSAIDFYTPTLNLNLNVDMNSLTHNGFKAWIASEGHKLPVYGVKTEGSTITCWVPSMPDTSFSVAWRKEDPRHVASSGHIFIDGRDVASGVMRPRRTRHVERSSVKVASSRARPFYFTALQLTDDEMLAPLHDDRLNEAGTIKLEITYVQLGTAVSIITTKVENISIAHEKAKKAGAMVTTFADPERIECGKAVSTRPYYPDNREPQATFVFRYHQKEMLQAWGISPNPASKRSRSDVDGEEEELNIKPVFINLDSDEEEDELAQPPSAKRFKHSSNNPFSSASSEAGSEPLYDVGDTGSAFGQDDEEDSKEELLKAMNRVRDEDAMSTMADEDEGASGVVIKKAHDEDEEPMEEDD